MIGYRQDIARLRSDFYRQQYHRILRWLMVSVVIIFILIISIIYLILVQPSRQYYVNTTEGKIISMPPPIEITTGSRN